MPGFIFLGVSALVVAVLTIPLRVREGEAARTVRQQASGRGVDVA